MTKPDEQVGENIIAEFKQLREKHDIDEKKKLDEAKIKLDAYGSDVAFDAHLIAVDPGETVIDGVATYKVTFEFNTDDPRLLSGLTADIDVLSSSRTDVLYIPTRDIFSKDGKKFVNLLVNPKTQEIKEVEISVGLKGSDSHTEVLSGLNEGDVIVE